LIAEEPIRYINERIAVCDGGNLQKYLSLIGQEGVHGAIQKFISMLINPVHIHVDIVVPHLNERILISQGGLRYQASKGQHEALSAVGAA